MIMDTHGMVIHPGSPGGLFNALEFWFDLIDKASAQHKFWPPL
jgi:hypothetical protein